MTKNRFAGLQAVKQLQENKQVEVKASLPKQSISKPVPAKTVSDIRILSSVESPKRGRPNGKRSNAEFQQVTAYVRRDTYRNVSIKLLDRENKGEFSELIEELLQEWLTKQK